jgi:hypothetical protein
MQVEVTSPESRPVPYERFRRLVGQYQRVPFLSGLAALSAELERQRSQQVEPDFPKEVREFSIAGLARTSLIAGTDTGGRQISPGIVLRLGNRYVNIADPDVAEREDRTERLMAKIAYEQFTVQYSPMENLARTVAIFVDNAAGVLNAPTAEQWRGLLGADLTQYMHIGFALYVAALHNPVTLTRELLHRNYVAPIFGSSSSSEALDVMDNHFAATLDEHRAYGLAKELPGREKWSPNPLQSRPVISVGDRLIAPSPHYLIEKITPTGLYFTGLGEWDTAFTTAVGTMFERYVGTQLALLRRAKLYPEIRYARSNKTCDYILVTGHVVVLIEVKAARPTLAYRAGESIGFADVRKKIDHARDQIHVTDQLIRDGGHPALAAIPANLPRAGLIVTLEPFYLTQTLGSDELLDDPQLPIHVQWAHELESLMSTLHRDRHFGEHLAAAVLSRAPAALQTLAYSKAQSGGNPVLDAAYNKWSPSGLLGDRTIR